MLDNTNRLSIAIVGILEWDEKPQTNKHERKQFMTTSTGEIYFYYIKHRFCFVLGIKYFLTNSMLICSNDLYKERLWWHISAITCQIIMSTCQKKWFWGGGCRVDVFLDESSSLLQCIVHV